MATDNENPENSGAESTPPAASVPSFGLLFQQPETVSAPEPPARPEPEDDRDDDHGADESAEQSSDQDEGGRRRRRRGGRGRNNRSGDEHGGKDEGGSEEQSGSDSSNDKNGKGDDGEKGGHPKKDGKPDNNGKSDNKGKADKNAEDSDDSGDDSSDSGDDSEDGQQGGGSSRRRRRRRRGGGGGGGNNGQDDPPGTVTKVRQSRRNEPQAIKGSTRLEAKKQRRREGREAGRRRTIITEAEFLARRESVERVMVVRQQEERTQIGVLEDGICVEHYVSRETTQTMVGNVYLGRVQNVLPSMEAAFVDIGRGRNAVLYAGEVNWEAQGVGNGQARKIESALSSGDSVLVQVTKDPIGHKGARLTQQISLPGRYLVYVPEGSMTGISRKLPDTERSRLKSILKQVVPDHSGVIVRTAAEGASEAELTNDVQRLTKAWEKISEKAEAKKGKKASAGGAPTLLHAEPEMTVRVIRDIFNEDFSKMVVSGDQAWSQIKDYIDAVAPDLADRLEKWTGEGDVFAGHRIDEAISKAMDRKVWLPSGGSLIIDRTEAMTVIDVNTGKFTGSGGNLEETVTKNNLEAAEEIVRQMRLRDIGGIIVVDFIDMVLESNRDLVVRRLLECLGRDRTKHQVAEVTSLGLVQMTRKRVGSGLIDVFSETCEHCGGRGLIVHSEPVAHDHSGGGDGGGNSRKGRSKGGKNKQSEPQPQQEEKDKNGNTAAQIAAAAHAAAVKTIAGEPSEDDGAVPEQTSTPEPEASEPEEPKSSRRRGGRRAASSAGAPVSLEPVDLTGAVAPAEAESAPEASEPEEPKAPRRRGGRRAASSAGAPVSLEPVDLTDAAAPAEPEPAPEPQPEPTPEPEASEPEEPKAPRRRGGRRAASSAGAPVSLEPVDLTASASNDSAPLTQVAGESGEAPTTPVADPEPPAPTRRKRKRVTSEAGPPQS